MIFLVFLFACLPFYFSRVISGPSVWDRLHALNLITVKVLLFIVLYASHLNASYLLDIAIVFALLGFISIVFTALFFLNRIKSTKEGGEGQ